jgi:5-oxopent-3-ene-1,2,5-tricarboxylate decarboxylase/2-hydroxyhepta-2,4-diene-1,7-dioate isomerase
MEDAFHQAPYKQPPKAPVLYIKPVNTLTGANSGIPLPTGEEKLEMGASLAVVIGKTATRVKAEDAFDYIEGYTIANDVSIPHASVYRPAIKQKARDGFCPIGPWIVSKEDVANPDQLDIRVYVNGELKQENSTRNFIRPVSKLIEDVTDFMTLRPGDVLLAGVPEGAPLAGKGDRVRIEISGMGALENTIVPEERGEAE